MLAGPYLLWSAAFIIIPLIMVFYYGLTNNDGGFTLMNLARITEPENLKALGLALLLSLVSTIICLILAYPLAMILTGLGVNQSSFIVLIFILPMWMNSLLRIIAWQNLLEKNGVINSLLHFFHLPALEIINTPYAIVLGMVYDFLYGFSAGAHIYFLTRMPSPKIISQSFSEIKPRVISCVPLIVEKIIKKDILPKVDSKIGKLLLKVPIVNDKIKSLARQAAMEIFGGNFDEIIIGGAPFNAEVEAFLKKIGFPYTIAYGMTECGPIICSSRWETLKLASCGKATSRMEVRIDSPDPETHAGEIVCRGMNMMLGYYKNPEATAQIIDANGWLHTGDLGTLDEEGYITVRGRSKNLLLTSSGQNIYPEEIESKLNNMPYVAESLIVLQHEKLVAMIYPDFDDAFAHGLQQTDIQKVMEQNRIELNQQLPNYSQISKIKIHFEEFEKTAKKSIKRFMYQEAKG